MNGIVRASIRIYNYKQASVHKTDEVERSCQDQIRHSLQTNPTWTQPVKNSARVSVSHPFSLISSLCASTRLTCHVPFMVRFLVLLMRFVSRDLDHAWLRTVPNVPLRQFLVFQISILKCKAFLFPLTPFFIVKIDVGSL